MNPHRNPTPSGTMRFGGVGGGSCLLLLLVSTAPQQRDRVAAFSPPRNHHRHHRAPPQPPPCSRSDNGRGTTTATTATTTSIPTAFGIQTQTATRLLAGGGSGFVTVPDVSSLQDVASDPKSFPTTSEYVRALQGASVTATEPPSAEEFLTRLSSEMRRAARSRSSSESATTETTRETDAEAGVSRSSSSSSSSSSPSSFLGRLAESTLPAAVSATGVALAAEGYDPAGYPLLASRMTSSNERGGFFGDNVGGGTTEERVADYATASADAVVTGSAVGHADYAVGYADATSADTAAVAAATSPTMNAAKDVASPESFAAWHSQQGGGSNSLRDLAASVPVADLQQDVGYAASPPDSGVVVVDGVSNYYAPSAQDASAVNDYFGGGGYYLTDNAATDTAGLERATAPSMQDFADGASANIYDGAGGAFDLTSNPLAADAALPPPLEAATDPALIPQINDGFAESLSSQLSGLDYNGLHNMDGQTAADAIHKSPPSPLLSDYVKTKLDQIELPKIELSPPKLDKLDLPKVDFAGPKLEKLDLPKMDVSLPKLDELHLPKVPNPFSEMHLPSTTPPPSMREALASVKEALPSSKERLGEAFNAASRSFDTLGDTAADVANSLETLSGQAGDAAAAARRAGVRAVELSNSYSSSFKGQHAAAPAGGMADVGTSGARALENAVPSGGAPSLPRLDFETPTLPRVNLPLSPPHLPEVNVKTPTLPIDEMAKAPGAALRHVGDASLSDFGNGIVHSVQFIGGVLVKFLDLILGAAAGTSVASLLTDVQSSVTSVVDGAANAVFSTIDNLGNMSIKEILQHLVALVVAVADVLLKIGNAVVYLLSGRDGENWALQASTTAHDAGAALMATATRTYDDVTHETVAQLAHSIGDYSHHVGDQLLALVGNLNGAEGLSSLPLDADTLDSVATAVQTALTL